MQHELTAEQIEQIAGAIAAGSKIEAIKLYRTFTGCELKDAKDFIDHLSVELHAKDPARFAAPPKGCLGIFLMLVLLITAAGAIMVR